MNGQLRQLQGLSVRGIRILFLFSGFSGFEKC